VLDVDGRRRYDLRVTKDARPADAKRERVIAKFERSLAQLDAGQRIPHAEVLAMIDARYPESKK
jgi:predicted transcriptional regulator